MKHESERSSAALGVLLAAAVGLAATACLDVSERSRATAEVSGPGGTGVRLITSTRFVEGQQQPSDPADPDTAAVGVQLRSADTTRRELPTTVTRSLTETQRIFVQVALDDSVAAAESDSVNAELRLLIDGEERSRVVGDLLDRPLEVSFTSFVAG